MAERGNNMGKVYGANGEKMNLSAICNELVMVATDEQKKLLHDNIMKYEFDNSQMKLAHGILDSYKGVDGTTEQGSRVRKLMDNLMNKYQKSTVQASADDQSTYHNLICELGK